MQGANNAGSYLQRSPISKLVLIRQGFDRHNPTSVRQLLWELGHENAVSIHLTLIPYLAAAGELKTKPTQIRNESNVSPAIANKKAKLLRSSNNFICSNCASLK